MPARRWDAATWVGDPSAARRVLGWEPAVALRTGLAATAELAARPSRGARAVRRRRPTRSARDPGPTTTPAILPRRMAPTRENMALRRTERWQPPPFVPPAGPAARAAARARRALDLQAASIWSDLRELLGDVRGTVLDVGAGAQPYRGLLPPGVEYLAVDTEDAKRHFGYAVPGTRYFSGSRWPVEDGAVDLVLATETLEHVPAPDGFLAEAARVLRPGGRIVLTVPFAARWHYVPYDYWRFTPSSLALLLEAAGFRGVVVHGRGNALTVACAKVMALMLPALLPQGRPRRRHGSPGWPRHRWSACWPPSARRRCGSAAPARTRWDGRPWRSGREGGAPARLPGLRDGERGSRAARGARGRGAPRTLAFASRKPPELMHWRLLECAVCDTVYASPAPAPDAVAAAYATAEFDTPVEAGYAAATYARELDRLLDGRVARAAPSTSARVTARSCASCCGSASATSRAWSRRRHRSGPRILRCAR